MTAPCATFSSVRSISRGRVNAAAEDAARHIDELIQKITESISKIELEIQSVKTRLDGYERRILQEKATQSLEITALRAEIAEANRVAHESLKIAKQALDHAQNHAHRYNPGCDWRTARAYKCDASTPQWEI